METPRDIQKKYCSQAMIMAITLAILMILIGKKPMGKGLVLGTFFSVTNFLIMGQFLLSQIEGGRSRTRAGVFALGSIFFRFAILAIPLVISMRVNSISFIGVVLGLFMVQVAILIDHLLLDRFLPFKKV
jgi:ATP synthase protein I